MLLWVALPAAVCAAQLCQDRPVPTQPPPALRSLIDREAELIDPGHAGRAVGLVLPPSAGVRFGRAASAATPVPLPDHPAIGALLASRPLRLEEGALARSRRTTALAAATRISRHLDEFLEEPGPFSTTARRWAAVDPDRRIARMAADLERLVPNLGWHSERAGTAEAFVEISAMAEISPARLRPMVSAILLVDHTLAPQSLAIRGPDSGGVWTWYLAAPPPAHELLMLRRISFQGDSRFDSYAVCRAKE
jgi:hypothetical protein